MPSDRLTDNPFYVLGITPDATSAEVEVAGQGLLAALAADAPGAERYYTPLGPQQRDRHAVRRALTRLRDVEERIHHEIWAGLSPRPRPRPVPAARPSQIAGWPNAPRAMGWWDR